MSFAEKVRDRGMISKSVIYLGAAWVIVEAIDFATGTYGLPRQLLDVGLFLLAVGFLVHLVVAWNHGEQGAQKPPRSEIAILSGLAVVGLIGSGVLFNRQVEPVRDVTLLPAGAEDLGEGSVAVLPFSNNSGADSLRWLGAGIADMLTTNLAQFPALRVVSAQRLLDLLRQAGSDETDRIPDALAQQITARSGAHMYIAGQIAVIGSEYRVDARLIDVSDGTVVAAETARGQDLFGVIDSVGVRLSRQAAGAGAVQPTEFTSVTEMATGDLDAYREYREGLTAERRFLFSEAIEHYQQAIAADSTFALAVFRLGSLYGQTGRFGQAGGLFAQAQRHIGGASERDKLLIDGLTMFFQNDQPGATASLEELIRKYPDEKDGRIWLGVLYANQDMADERLEMLEDLVSLDPFYGPAYNELAYSAARAGEFQKADSLISRYAELEPDQPNPWDSKGEILEMAGDVDGARVAFRRAIEVDPSFYQSYDHLVRTYLRTDDGSGARGELVELVAVKDPAGAVEAQILVGDSYVVDAQFLEALRYYQMAAETADRAGRSDLQGKALANVAQAAMTTGQWDVADAATRTLRSIDPANYNAFFLSLAVAGELDRIDEARRGRDQAAQALAQLPPQVQQLASSVLPLADGIIAFYEEDYEATARLLETARTSPGSNMPPLSPEIVALIELGRTDEALALLDTAERWSESAEKADRYNRLGNYGLPYLRGLAHEKAGNTDEAVAAYQATIDMAGGGLREYVEIRDAPERLAALEASE